MKKIYSFLKRVYNLFRTENQQEKGLLGIKGHYLSLDKQKHILYGYLFFCTLDQFLDTGLSLAITIIVAIIKEILDHTGITNMIFKTGKTAASVPDILVTIFIPVLIQLIKLYLI